MYHTVKTSELDQYTHRFLWRDMDSTREPDTYIIQRVSFGDKPSGTIATIALRKMAQMTRNEYSEAALANITLSVKFPLNNLQRGC